MIPNSSSSSILSLLVLLLFSTSSSWATNSIHEDFLNCLSIYKSSFPIPIYTSKNSSFNTLFRSSARNLRFLSPNSTQKPEFIITPTLESHVQTTVVCSKKHGLDLKVRSGGHDVEGLSYVSDSPYVMIDLVDFRNITVNVKNATAWIQAGSSLGEVYYKVGNESKNTLGFPAGFCPTVGVGGHISGGGFGSLVRKYGLASDQVIDARIVTVNGEILNKETMGKDLYWAIRGGGANNFGVLLSWKVKLVPVTPIVTVATIDRTLEQGATNLVHKWQFVADRLHEDVYIGLTMVTANTSRAGEKTVVAQFSFLFLGNTDRLLQIMEESFPELGLKRNDTTEMSWVESHVYFYRRGQPIEFLWDRDHLTKSFLKVKSDYVREPISKLGLEGIWKRYVGGDSPAMLWTPFGGRMNQISEFESPYPHRAGNIYNIMYVGNWLNENESEKQLNWMRSFYSYMGRYVSKNPRSAYLNYKDLDLGVNDNNVSEYIRYLKARSWGRKYFKNNFEKLVKVKSMVDPDNFFKNKQSIPPIRSWGKELEAINIVI
uniref:Tetrahydroberberine oxidase n=1 Tax=Argemone mexicana TaxID=54796 RepID=STOX_ARGME|nr:RecName: Full=Tetrahydroberberine oxidase; Short=THB oxidase; AltName: Full=(S)-tetrahydroprotoberberine oxidase; Short=AmSTOX; Flags: Precursor [Argemone mexicana]ADY15027.1 (S)-tetrahydroprotoberberine oxidase [Argemone mexicana]